MENNTGGRACGRWTTRLWGRRTDRRFSAGIESMNIKE